MRGKQRTYSNKKKAINHQIRFTELEHRVCSPPDNSENLLAKTQVWLFVAKNKNRKRGW